MALFITFEGGEGSGKTVQAGALYRRLSRLAIPALLIHEPGSTSLGRKLARLLKWAGDVGISPLTELLMFNASRAQLVEEVVQPALELPEHARIMTNGYQIQPPFEGQMQQRPESR